MLDLSNCKQNFVIDDVNFFNNFNKNSFISSADIALQKSSIITMDVDASHYKKSFSTLMSYLDNTKINTLCMVEYFTSILGSERISSENSVFRMGYLDINNNIIIKPQYLLEAVNVLKNTINKIVSGEYDVNDINMKCVDIATYTDVLMYRVISGLDNYNVTPEIMLKEKINSPELTILKVSRDEMENIVIPFLDSFNDKKKSMMDEISSVYSIIIDTCIKINDYILYVNKGINDGIIDGKAPALIMEYSYNHINAILNCISFVTYLYIDRAYRFEYMSNKIRELYEHVTYVFSDVNTLTESGIYDNNMMTASDSNNIVEKLLDGKNDIFVEAVNNIMEYHRGYISLHMSDAIGSDVDGDLGEFIVSMAEKHEYEKKLYDEIVMSYIEIGNGIDILAANSDDYLMIFDDLIKKSGFTVTLEQRFSSVLDNIRDVNNYNITNISNEFSEDYSTYFRLIGEISNYPKNTLNIANSAKDIWTKLDYVSNIFTNKSHGELEYSETMNELKIFMESLKEQYLSFNREMVKRLYHRLKVLASKADICLNSNKISPETDPGYVLGYNNDDDFFEEYVLNILETIHDENDCIMESMLKQYYSEREYLERGIRVVYEADTSTPTTSTNASNISNTISNLIKQIFEKFSNVVNKYKQKNTDWLKKNKEALLTRSYSNVSINILPYHEAMPMNTIYNNINTMKTNIGVIKNNMSNIKSYEEMRSKLFTFGPKFNDNESESVTLTNYFKVGKQPLEVKAYSNGEIKKLVSDVMIPFCEDYYTNLEQTLKSKIDDLSESVKMESVYMLITENETNSTNNSTNSSSQQQAPSTTPTVNTTGENQSSNNKTNSNNDNTSSTQSSDQIKWLNKCVSLFTGAILNSVRSRNNDYFKVLTALAPKIKVKNNQNQGTSNSNTTNTSETPSET